jgi:hypothetical protein
MALKMLCQYMIRCIFTQERVSGLLLEAGVRRHGVDPICAHLNILLSGLLVPRL